MRSQTDDKTKGLDFCPLSETRLTVLGDNALYLSCRPPQSPNVFKALALPHVREQLRKVSSPY
jgi:hypothetical protein